MCFFVCLRDNLTLKLTSKVNSEDKTLEALTRPIQNRFNRRLTPLSF
jgi:hypothetical protein